MTSVRILQKLNYGEAIVNQQKFTFFFVGSSSGSTICGFSMEVEIYVLRPTFKMVNNGITTKLASFSNLICCPPHFDHFPGFLIMEGFLLLLLLTLPSSMQADFQIPVKRQIFPSILENQQEYSQGDDCLEFPFVAVDVFYHCKMCKHSLKGFHFISVLTSACFFGGSLLQAQRLFRYLMRPICHLIAKKPLMNDLPFSFFSKIPTLDKKFGSLASCALVASMQPSRNFSSTNSSTTLWGLKSLPGSEEHVPCSGIFASSSI